MRKCQCLARTLWRGDVREALVLSAQFMEHGKHWSKTQLNEEASKTINKMYEQMKWAKVAGHMGNRM